jgi:hypothetical protein
MTVRCFAGITWGLKPHISNWLYVAIVRPQITYGAIIWWHKALQVTVMEKLTKLQRLGCLCATGAFRSTPTVALEALLGITPLDIYIQSETRLSAYHMFHLGNWRENTLRKGHTQITSFLKNPILEMQIKYYANTVL